MDCIYDKVRFLVQYLNECTKAYDEGNPKITDEEWDNKYFELKSLEEETGRSEERRVGKECYS